MYERKPPNKTLITVSGFQVKVTRKRVKNINLRVYPSKGEVCISAPWHVHMKAIRGFAESKSGWIQKHMMNYKAVAQPVEPEYLSGETHRYRGKKLDLRVLYHDAKPQVRFLQQEGMLEMKVRHGSNKEKRYNVLKEWYRARLKEEITKLIEKWERPMGVSVNEFGVKQMKTRWGSCNMRVKRIWLNLELAKKSRVCLEYVVVHEMVHLLERLHDERFYKFMDRFLPNWRGTEKELRGRVD